MAKIVYTDKQVGGLFTHENANEIKESVNALYDQTGPIEAGTATGQLTYWNGTTHKGLTQALYTDKNGVFISRTVPASESLSTTNFGSTSFGVDQILDDTAYPVQTATPQNHHLATFFSTILVTTAKVTDPYKLIEGGLRARINYGSASVGATGTAHSLSCTFDVINSPSATSEHCTYFGFLRYNDGTKGRAWFTDFALIGSNVQQELLNGITMVVNNRFNGSPSAGLSAGQWIVTKPAAGASNNWITGTFYSVDVGLGIVGYAGSETTPAQGFANAIKIGGSGSGWMTGQRSIISVGIRVSDTSAAGILIESPRGTNAANGIRMGATTGDTWNHLINFAGANPASGAIMLSELNETAGIITWGLTNAPKLSRSADNTLKITGKLLTTASVAGYAGLNVPHGVAPTSPVNGDVWTTTAGMFVQINGVTKSINLT